MEGWERALTPEQKACLPRVHGINPEPVLGQATYGTLGTSYPECLPPPPPGQPPYVQQRPTPMVARRGQVLVFCSTCLHSAWHNEDDVPRKAMGSSWAAVGVPGKPRDPPGRFQRILIESLCAKVGFLTDNWPASKTFSQSCATACRRSGDTSCRRWLTTACTSRPTTSRGGRRPSAGRKRKPSVLLPASFSKAEDGSASPHSVDAEPPRARAAHSRSAQPRPDETDLTARGGGQFITG